MRRTRTPGDPASGHYLQGFGFYVTDNRQGSSSTLTTPKEPGKAPAEEKKVADQTEDKADSGSKEAKKETATTESAASSKNRAARRASDFRRGSEGRRGKAAPHMGVRLFRIVD